MSEQELPVGYQLPNPYENHPEVITHDKFLSTDASKKCQHYENRTQYFCALCRYEFIEKEIRKGLQNETK